MFLVREVRKEDCNYYVFDLFCSEIGMDLLNLKAKKVAVFTDPTARIYFNWAN